jgi:hypothetical protein
MDCKWAASLAVLTGFLMAALMDFSVVALKAVLLVF